MSTITELDSHSTDTISAVEFSPSGNKLLIAGWDSNINIFRRDDQTFVFDQQLKDEAPLLGACWGRDDDHIFTVGLHGLMKHWRPSEGTSLWYNSHPYATNRIAYSRAHDVVFTTSWDNTLCVYNAGADIAANIILVTLKDKPFALGLTDDKLVVAMCNRHISVYDINVLKEKTLGSEKQAARSPTEVAPWQERESSLRWQIRAITGLPDGKGFVTSSIEGRVALDWFAEEDQSRNYAFKCHRQKELFQDEEGEIEGDMVYSVHAIAFSPVHTNSFVTAGGDGVVAVWDAATKRRIRQYPRLEGGCSSVAFSPDGSLMAIGVSPEWTDAVLEQSKAGTLPPSDPSQFKVYIRHFAENELKGKGK